MENGAIDTDLDPVVAALAGISDAELQALIAATYGVPKVAPGLLAWLDAACDLERNRQRGFDYPLQPPEAAIPPEENAISIDTAIAMREMFAQDSPALGAPRSVRWRSSIYRVKCPQPRH
jgi:hypothetical protein